MRHFKQVTAILATGLLGAIGLATAASFSPPGNETTNYSYDELGRLVKVEQGDANSNTVSNYTFDKAGNRTNVTVTRTP